MRVADFFCGGGGFSEGFRQAGYEIVFAVDKWEPAVTTYKGNKPGVNVIQDDVIRLSKLPDEEFNKIIPDSEVIIGSPPCQTFSRSNKSGNADKSIGIELIEAYLRIIARKKFKENSCLKYWVLENVPNVKNYIEDKYTAANLGLKGDFILKPKKGNSGIYNAKYFGAPTNRERYLCGEFPKPQSTNDDSNVITLKQVLESLRKPLDRNKEPITDINYPELELPYNKVSDHHYIYELAKFEWATAKRLKQDKGYMGKMSFPENVDKPSRTVMATMSTSSREAMIIGYGKNKYRLPTVREVATMMSFPIDYRFYGKTKATKHTLVGNAVPPKMSYALAVAMAREEKVSVPKKYCPIQHDKDMEFLDLNGSTFEVKKEKEKREVAKFKYHIPYFIINAYRVELTNYHSDFDRKLFIWDVEVHYSQGKKRAKVYQPQIDVSVFSEHLLHNMDTFIENEVGCSPKSYGDLQKAFCMTEEQRKKKRLIGPYELLEDIKKFIISNVHSKKRKQEIEIVNADLKLPYGIVVGYYLLNQIIKRIGGDTNGY